MSPPALTRIFFSFLRLGLTAFGGPAMVAYIKELSVKKNKWLDEERFRDGVVLCQSIPGATAMQMAGYVGLRLKGIRGALASFVGLLLYVLIKFALAIPWDIIRVLLGVAALMALIKKTDLLYVVIIGGIVSIWLFS